MLRGSLTETYAEGRREIHIHLRTGVVNGRVAGDWCAIFNRTEDRLDFVRSEPMNPESKRNGSKEGDMRQTMFVLDGKLVELPEGVVSILVSSLVRLQPLDNRLCIWVRPRSMQLSFFRLFSLRVHRIGKAESPSILLVTNPFL